MNPSLEEMTAEQLKEQVKMQGGVLAKQSQKIGWLSTQQMQGEVIAEMKEKENQELRKENERLLGVIAELKEGKKEKSAK